MNFLKFISKIKHFQMAEFILYRKIGLVTRIFDPKECYSCQGKNDLVHIVPDYRVICKSCNIILGSDYIYRAELKCKVCTKPAELAMSYREKGVLLRFLFCSKECLNKSMDSDHVIIPPTAPPPVPTVSTTTPPVPTVSTAPPTVPPVPPTVIPVIPVPTAFQSMPSVPPSPIESNDRSSP